MGRMEEYRAMPAGIPRGWWGTRLDKLIKTPITLWRPLSIAREGPGAATEQRATQGQAGLPSKVEPHTQRQIAAPVPLMVKVYVLNTPLFVPFGSRYVQ